MEATSKLSLMRFIQDLNEFANLYKEMISFLLLIYNELQMYIYMCIDIYLCNYLQSVLSSILTIPV